MKFKENIKTASIVKPKSLEKLDDDISDKLMSIREIQLKYNLSFPFKVIRIQDSTRLGKMNPLKTGVIYTITNIDQFNQTNNWAIRFVGIIPFPTFQCAVKYKDYKLVKE